MSEKIKKNQELENQENQEQAEQSGAAAETPTVDPPKQKFRVRIRAPFEKIPVKEPTQEEIDAKSARKKSLKQRLATFGKGAATGALILGAGLVAYGKAKKAQELEEQEDYVDVSSEEDDSEYQRTIRDWRDVRLLESEAEESFPKEEDDSEKTESESV